MSEKFGLSFDTQEKIKAIFKLHPKIQKVIIYGSRAKGNYRPGSDIDITLFAEDMSLTELFQIENELDDLLLPYKIDLSLFHNLENPSLIDHINRVGQEF